MAKLEKVNEDKVIKMALIHDLAEVRGGERNLINKFYSQTINEPKIIEEISKDYYLKDFGITKIFEEFFKEKKKEAEIVRDADIFSSQAFGKRNF